MKLLKHLFALIIVCNQLIAQTSPPSKQWAKTISGQFSSPFEGTVKSTKDNVGNVYVLCQDYINIYVVKYNTSGAISDVMTYNGPDNGVEYAYDIKLDNLGNVIIGASVFNYGFYCPAIIKFDVNGDLLWAKILTQPLLQQNNVKSIAVDQNNDVYFTGSYNDSLLVGKINSLGSIVWKKTMVPNAFYSLGFGNSIAVDNNGFSYLCGKVKNQSNDFDFFLTKLNTTGSMVWYKVMDGVVHGDDEALFVKIDNNYNCYVGGTMLDSSATNKTAMVAKYNSAGGQQWLKKLYQANQEDVNFNDYQMDNQSNSYVVLKENNLGSNYLNSRVIKLSNLGNISWNNTYTGNGLDQDARSVAIDNFSNVVVCGSGQQASGNDEFILKYNSSGNLLYTQLYDYATTFGEYPSTVLIDNSGSIYMSNTLTNSSTSKSDVGLVKFNSVGALQFESYYNAPSSSISQGVKLIFKNNQPSVLGSIINDGSGFDMALSNYDDLGNVDWQNVVDFDLGNNEAFDFEKQGTETFVVGSTGMSQHGTVVYKFDAIGSPVWFDTLQPTVYTKVLPQSNGHVSFIGQRGYGNSEKDFRIVIYNSTTGQRLFQNNPTQYPNYVTEIRSATVDITDNVFAFGMNRLIGTPFITKLQLQKFSPAGSILWTKEISGFDSTDYEEAVTVIADSLLNSYAFAYAKDVATGKLKSIAVKYDANGNLLWKKTMGSASLDEVVNSAIYGSDNFIYLYSTELNASPVVVRKIDPVTGNIIWTKKPGLYPFQAGNGGKMAMDSLQNIFIATHGFYAGPVTSNNDGLIILCKLNSSGNLQWKSSFDGLYRGDDQPNDIKVSNNGRIYLLASAVMNNFSNNPDITLVKLCDIPEPIITSSSTNIKLCPGSSVNLQASGGTSYLWNYNNVTTPSILADTTGEYFATVFLSDGCFKNTDTISVNLVTPQTPNICMVSVDSLSNYNQIFWDKTLYQMADSFIVHREVSSNIYKRVGAVSKSAFSMFTDTNRTIGPANGDPNISSYRYKLQLRDSCGNYSSLSPYHNSIYFITNSTGTYFWNTYNIEGQAITPASTFNLLRDDNGTGIWNVVGSTAGTQTTLNDPAYASYPLGVWRVEALGFNCFPTLRTTQQINKTKSNVKNNFSISTGINSLSQNEIFTVAPNPATTELIVSFNTEIKEKTLVTITNVLGKTVLVQEINEGRTMEISLSELVTGVYFIRIQQGNNFTDKKFIKN